MTDRLVYCEEELLADHDYAEPQVVNGTRLHGGFLADGTYVPPRTLLRQPAIEAWERALLARGGAPFGASARLLDGVRMPTAAQQLVLLRNGLGESFWNNLTIIGKIEARGRALADVTFPDLQAAVVDDISEMAIGHLNKGLLLAHGLDEGGEPDKGIGGHDQMWFVARDLAFGDTDFDDVEPMDNIGRPDAGHRHVPEIAPEIEGLVSFLANLLIIEFRAELGFADTQEILRTPEVFTDRREEAELAAEIVERIRTDEAIHVRSLNLYLGEMRSVDFTTVEGGTVSGAELIDRFWDGMVRWATVEQPELARQQQETLYRERITAHPDAGRVMEEFRLAG